MVNRGGCCLTSTSILPPITFLSISPDPGRSCSAHLMFAATSPILFVPALARHIREVKSDALPSRVGYTSPTSSLTSSIRVCVFAYTESLMVWVKKRRRPNAASYAPRPLQGVKDSRRDIARNGQKRPRVQGRKKPMSMRKRFMANLREGATHRLAPFHRRPPSCEAQLLR